MTAITDDGIDELRDFIADFHHSPEEWDAFLRSVINDQETNENVKTHKPR